MVNAQEWLDQNYLKETRSSLKELVIKQESLEGHLDLKDFVNLEELDCINNQLTSLDLSNCKQLKRLLCGVNQLTELDLTKNLNQLEKIGCNDNYLTSFDYSSLNPKKLTYLNISDNNLLEQDLAIFSRFINLERLFIGGGDEEKIKQDIVNHFTGSLESLKDLKKLLTLELDNTDVNEGLEYLPDSIKEIYCSYQARPESKVRKLAEQLSQNSEFFLDDKNYMGLDNSYQRIQKEVPTNLNANQQKQWTVVGFTIEEAQEWIKVGLQKEESDFAIYLKKQGYTPTNADLQNNHVQYWLSWQYPLEKRKEITILDINNKNLVGELVLNNFPHLTRMDCYNNQLTKLNITNCPQLRDLNADNNFLTYLIISNPDQLTSLSIQNNKFPPQDLSFFSQFVNCEELWLSNNAFFGSLEPLKKLKKLKRLDTSHNKFTTGLEYLPERAEEIILQKSSNNLETVRQELQLYTLSGRGILSTYSLEQWRNDQLPYQQLKEYLEKLGYSQLNELLEDIFFNVRTGTFEGTTETLFSFLTNLKEKDDNLRLLERMVEELQVAIKQQKEKILQAYLHFAPEKELLKELINAELTFKKAKEQSLLSVKLRKTKQKLYDELEEKLSEEQMEKVELVLTDCDKLVELELELETKFNCKLINEFPNQQIILINSSINIQQGNAIIGNNFRGNANLSYIEKITEKGLITKTKRRLSLYESEQQTKTTKLDQGLTQESENIENMVVDNSELIAQIQISSNLNWNNLHSSFSNQQLINHWINNNFNYEQTQEWINIGLTVNDSDFCAWLRDFKHLTAEQCLNYHNLEQLRSKYQEQFQSQTQIPPKLKTHSFS